MSFSRWTAAVRTDGRTRENVIEPALQVWDENISFLLIKFTRSPPPPTPRKICLPANNYDNQIVIWQPKLACGTK